MSEKIKESNSEFVECKDGIKENIESEIDIEDPLEMTESIANSKTHVLSAHEEKKTHVCFICKSSFRFTLPCYSISNTSRYVQPNWICEICSFSRKRNKKNW